MPSAHATHSKATPKATSMMLGRWGYVTRAQDMFESRVLPSWIGVLLPAYFLQFVTPFYRGGLLKSANPCGRWAPWTGGFKGRRPAASFVSDLVPTGLPAIGAFTWADRTARGAPPPE